VKPPPFDYYAPRTVDEAVELLASHDGARVLAGGQSLMQLLKFRAVKPPALVDINGIGELGRVERAEGELSVGALVRQQHLLEDSLVADEWPLLAQAAQYVGYRETRRRGTLGGSLAFAAPWGELTAAVIALDARIDVKASDGERTIAAEEFFRGPNETALSAGELVVRVRFPATEERRGTGFHEVSVRARDYAQVAAAAVVSETGRARLVLLCVARTPCVLDTSEVFADGSASVDERALEDLLGDLDPVDDVEATAAYRRRVAPVLARRALEDAARALERSAT
jgi:CO/xanthine dehydrogenase FAD-binding subunit